MKTAALIVLLAVIGYLVAGLFVSREPPKLKRLRRLRRHFLKMRDKGVVFDKPQPDSRSSIETFNRLQGRNT